MDSITIYPTSINERAIDRVVECLRDGGIILYPTDTVYALGCNALDNRAIERICAYKGINPAKQNLSVVCADISQAAEYARIDNRAFSLIKRHVPGPFTFIMPASSRLPKVFKGRHTVGIRIPDNDIARAIAGALGNPLLSTSVRIDSDDPEQSTIPAALEHDYDNIADMIVDGGEGGLQLSTIIDCTDSTNPEVTRQGKGQL